MLSLEEAQARVLAAVQSLGDEARPLGDSAGRILAENIIAPVSLPVFDNSAMDGFALRAADVTGATREQPARLRQIGAVAAGSSFNGVVMPGTCVRIFTGSPLPRGADAVVMQEDTETRGENVTVLDAVKPWENIRLAGEDVKAGTRVAAAGERITPQRLALLGALGVSVVRAARPPVVAVMATGCELLEPRAGVAPGPGKIFESNRTMLASLAAAAGCAARVLPIVPDDLRATTSALEAALHDCDAIITSGGVSVGEHDYVKEAFTAAGGKIDLWRVAVKPGKPFVFGERGGKFLFGLPGNPVSAFVTFLLLVRPALLRMQGAASLSIPRHPAVLAEPMHNRGERRHFMRVLVDDEGEVRSAGVQASHALGSLASANALLDVPPNTSWPAGHSVRVLRW